MLCRVLAALGLAAMVWLYIAVRWTAMSQPKEHADAIIVLGCGGGENGPSRVYRSRLDRGVELLKSGFADRIIVTEKAPVADGARRYLMGEGIPEDQILVEDQSTTTYENLLYSRNIMREAGLLTAIVTSCPFHLYRAQRMCVDLGIPAQVAGSDSPLEREFRSRARWSLSECWKYTCYRAQVLSTHWTGVQWRL